MLGLPSAGLSASFLISAVIFSPMRLARTQAAISQKPFANLMDRSKARDDTRQTFRQELRSGVISLTNA